MSWFGACKTCGPNVTCHCAGDAMKAFNEAQSKAVQDDPCVIGTPAWFERQSDPAKRSWDPQMLAEMRRLACETDPPADELAALRAENEQLKAQLARDDKVKAEYWDHACKVGAENERLKADLANVIAERHQLANDLACRALPAAAPAPAPSGPSWLERVAAGPQRIGIPLP